MTNSSYETDFPFPRPYSIPESGFWIPSPPGGVADYDERYLYLLTFPQQPLFLRWFNEQAFFVLLWEMRPTFPFNEDYFRTLFSKPPAFLYEQFLHVKIWRAICPDYLPPFGPYRPITKNRRNRRRNSTTSFLAGSPLSNPLGRSCRRNLLHRQSAFPVAPPLPRSFFAALAFS